MMYGEKAPSRIRRFLKTLLVSIFILAICGMLADGLRESKAMVRLDENALVLSLAEADTYIIPFESILSLCLVEDFDIGECVDGIENKNCYYGVWQNKELGEYVLCMNRNTVDVMLIESKDGVYAVSVESDQMTASYLDEFSEILEEWRNLS